MLTSAWETCLGTYKTHAGDATCPTYACFDDSVHIQRASTSLRERRKEYEVISQQGGFTLFRQHTHLNTYFQWQIPIVVFLVLPFLPGFPGSLYVYRVYSSLSKGFGAVNIC